jgi:hypothetical protein
MKKHTRAAVLAVRLMGLFWLTAGLCMLAANIIESATAFDPTYAGYYLQSQALRPGLAILLGVILWMLAWRLGRLAARGLGGSDDE